MKELSIEQKAKRYDKALEWMRSVYPTMEGAAKEDAEHYFTELAEQEDERIGKEIISALKWVNYKGVYDKHIAWIEKQLKVEEVMRDIEQKAKAFTEAHKGETSEEILAQMKGLM